MTDQNDICNGFRTLLLGIASVSGAVDGNVWADQAPQQTEPEKYIRFYITDERGSSSHGAMGMTSSGGQILNASIQCDIFVKRNFGSAVAKTIGGNIINNVNGGSVNISGADASICTIQNGILFDDGDYYQLSIDFIIEGQIY